MAEYYVYLLLDPRKFYLPFYVGKGKGDRWQWHLRESAAKRETNLLKARTIQNIRAAGFEPAVMFWATGLAEDDAYAAEADLIQRFGRRRYDPDGILTNLCVDARPPDRTGWVMPEEVRKRIGDSNRGGKTANHGEANGFYGKRHTPETLAVLAENARTQWTGVVRPEETRKKMSEYQSRPDVVQVKRERRAEYNKAVGRERSLRKVEAELPLYQGIFAAIDAGKSLLSISEEFSVTYGRLYKIAKKRSYYEEIISEVNNRTQVGV